MDRFLYHLGRLFVWVGDCFEAHDEEPAWRRWGRRLAVWGTIGYAVALAVVLAGMHWLTDAVWLFSVLVFLPPLGWLLPLAGLTPLAAVCRRRWLWAHLGCGLALLFYMDVEWARERPAPADGGIALTVVTNNIGSDFGNSPVPWILSREPDLVLMQEASTCPEPLAVYGGQPSVTLGEFSLASRFPVVEAALVEGLTWRDAPVAARYELTTPAGPLIVYNVHLPTRQDMLGMLGGLGFLHEVLTGSLGGIWSAEVRAESQRQLVAFRELADGLASRIATEKGPVLVGGDFNMPPRGAMYRQFAAILNDAFEERGRGFGATIPGATGNPVALYRPWMRVDYLFVSPMITVLSCRTESGRRAQHRSVDAQFFLRAGK